MLAVAWLVVGAVLFDPVIPDTIGTASEREWLRGEIVIVCVLIPPVLLLCAAAIWETMP
jgi:hypothetical protein